MSIGRIAKRVLPARAVASLMRARQKFRQARIAARPALTETELLRLLREDLGLTEGDTVLVHSSMDQLHLAFPFYRLLPLIQQAIGAQGTVLFPTYPNRHISSYEYLLRGEVFNVRRSPAYTGLLNEYARRQPQAVRSLHPTKSVCALGARARELTAEHQNSPYPYDSCSPFYKLVETRGKIIGLGVWTQYLSFAYTVDDALKQDAPVETYHPRLFHARCIDYEGREVIVDTYAHNILKMEHDVPAFMRRHVAPDICRDLRLKQTKFFRADAPRLFARMLELARQGITIYPRSLYKEGYRPRAR